MMDNKPQALPCLQITDLAAQIAEKYGLRPVPYSALRRVYDTRFPLPVQTHSPNGQMWVDRYYIAWQLGSGPVRYGYLTRRHIFEELTAYRAHRSSLLLRAARDAPAGKKYLDFRAFKQK